MDKFDAVKFWECVYQRLTQDPYDSFKVFMPYLKTDRLLDSWKPEFDNETVFAASAYHNISKELEWLNGMGTRAAERALEQTVSSIMPNDDLEGIFIDPSEALVDPTPPFLVDLTDSKEEPQLENVEIVIVRPNIEHSMLGIIMGLGGNELGNTLWGQTELSVYDDSMHGVWGM